MKYSKILFLLAAFSLYADEEATHYISFGKLPAPWFTGPLIAPTGFTVKPGHFNLQAYFDSYVNVGAYNSDWSAESVPNFYNIGLRVRFRAGITSFLDAQITPRVFFYKGTQGHHSTGIGDIPLGFNIQLLTYGLNDPWPAIKLVLLTTIPCGKYQKLNPSKMGTDVRGTGSWYPEVDLVVSKLWHLSGIHYLDFRIFTGYTIGTPTHIKGLSVYGGDSTTRGTAYPGNTYFADASLQYNLTQSWALVFEGFYLHVNRSRFSGTTTTPSVRPSSELYSLAPAIEYNFNENIGLIGGVWFSFIGRNTPQFINGILSLNAYF